VKVISMTRPRRELVSIQDTPWYHIVSRCVRRAFLCGEDTHSGRSYEHRRGWVEARIRQLAAVFTIDIAAYAIMSNHYHIVLRVDLARANGLSDDEALSRWTRLFAGPPLVQRHLNPTTRAQMCAAEVNLIKEYAALYRQRLADLSWFMRVLNEGIARQANKEDGVAGRFWEGRFKSQALLDEQALLSAMVYVDLNPVRAAIAETPESSDFTSIEARLAPERVKQRVAQTIETMRRREAVCMDGEGRTPNAMNEAAQNALTPAPLMPFDATGREDWAIPFAFEDYVELVEAVGRCVHPKKRGRIPEKTPKLLARLGINTEAFIEHGTRVLKEFGHAVGKPARLVELAAQRQSKFLRGMRTARQVFVQKAA
jgi:REP element-mobilizing transposase RayT